MRSFIIFAAAAVSLASLAGALPARSQSSEDVVQQLEGMPDRTLSIVLPTNPDNPNPIRDGLKALVANTKPGSMEPPGGAAQIAPETTPRASFASAPHVGNTFPGAPQEPKAESGFFVELGSPPAFFVELSKDAGPTGEPASIRSSLAPSIAGAGKFIPDEIAH